MLASPADLTTFFPEVECCKDEEWICAYVSVFDHWLTPEEATASRVMCYSQAVELGSLDEYLQGECRMMNFYYSLSELGLLWNRCGSISLVGTGEKKLTEIIKSNLREENFMDAYFRSEHVRVKGGYDRTDSIFLLRKYGLEQLRIKANAAGVFILL